MITTKTKRVYERRYLIVGLYDNGDRFADFVWAPSPESAEARAAALWPEVQVAAVIDRRRKVVA